MRAAKVWARKQNRKVDSVNALKRECEEYAKTLSHPKGCSMHWHHEISSNIRKCQQCRLLKCLHQGMTPESMIKSYKKR